MATIEVERDYFHRLKREHAAYRKVCESIVTMKNQESWDTVNELLGRNKTTNPGQPPATKKEPTR